MELLTSSTTTLFPIRIVSKFRGGRKKRVSLWSQQAGRASIRCSAEQSSSSSSSKRIDHGRREGESTGSGGGGGGGFTSPAMEVTTFDRSFGDSSEFPVWEKIGAVVRLSYGIGLFFLFQLFFPNYS